jgi:hypothetical protein
MFSSLDPDARTPRRRGVDIITAQEDGSDQLHDLALLVDPLNRLDPGKSKIADLLRAKLTCANKAESHGKTLPMQSTR